MAHYPYSGIWPVAPTPFPEDGTVDETGMRRVLDCMIDQGSDAICILANYSEQFVLSDEERATLMRVSLEHVAGRVAAGDGQTAGQQDVFRLKPADQVETGLIGPVRMHEAQILAGGIEALYCDYFDAQLALINRFEPAVVGHFDLIRIHDPEYEQRWEVPQIRDRALRNLERIGDHATNVAEMVHFAATGAYPPDEDG